MHSGVPCSEFSAKYAEVLVANTWECNLSCSYCFVERQLLNTAGGHMTPALADRLVDALDLAFPDVETVCIHLYGGEPLVNLPAIQAMVQKASQKPEGRFAFAITTNGTITTPEVFELLEAGRFYVILSIDGPAPIHDECRRTQGSEPSHFMVMRFLKTLRRRTNCQVWGSAVVRSGWSLAEAEAYLSSLPVDAIKAQAIRACQGDSFALKPDERRNYLDDLAALGRMVIEDLEAKQRPRDDRFSSRVFQLLKGISRERYCESGLFSFGITPDGTVLGCLLLDSDENRIGRIDDDPSTWRRAGAVWTSSRSPGAECENCAAMPLCGGGCPAINPICGESECEIVRKNCEVAREIYEHFRDRPQALLGLAGIF